MGQNNISIYNAMDKARKNPEDVEDIVIALEGKSYRNERIFLEAAMKPYEERVGSDSVLKGYYKRFCKAYLIMLLEVYAKSGYSSKCASNAELLLVTYCLLEGYTERSARRYRDYVMDAVGVNESVTKAWSDHYEHSKTIKIKKINNISQNERLTLENIEEWLIGYEHPGKRLGLIDKVLEKYPDGFSMEIQLPSPRFTRKSNQNRTASDAPEEVRSDCAADDSPTDIEQAETAVVALKKRKFYILTGTVSLILGMAIASVLVCILPIPGRGTGRGLNVEETPEIKSIMIEAFNESITLEPRETRSILCYVAPHNANIGDLVCASLDENLALPWLDREYLNIKAGDGGEEERHTVVVLSGGQAIPVDIGVTVKVPEPVSPLSYNEICGGMVNDEETDK